MLKIPPQQPWYAYYHFRFEAVRSNGDRLTYGTRIPSLSEKESHGRLWELLGMGRYDVTFLGCENIPMTQWPLQYKLECGLDKFGNPMSKPASKAPAADAGKGAESAPRTKPIAKANS